MQAKDLAIYIIDYDNEKLVKKITSSNFTVNMKSLFFDLDNLEENSPYFSSLKEKIEEEKRLGNHVRIPKKNDSIIIIQ